MNCNERGASGLSPQERSQEERWMQLERNCGKFIHPAGSMLRFQSDAALRLNSGLVHVNVRVHGVLIR